MRYFLLPSRRRTTGAGQTPLTKNLAVVSLSRLRKIPPKEAVGGSIVIDFS